jgi:hypothetical protein
MGCAPPNREPKKKEYKSARKTIVPNPLFVIRANKYFGGRGCSFSQFNQEEGYALPHLPETSTKHLPF